MLSKSEISRRICVSEAKKACSIHKIEVLENPYLLRGINQNFQMMKCRPDKNRFWTRVIFDIDLYVQNSSEFGGVLKLYGLNPLDGLQDPILFLGQCHTDITLSRFPKTIAGRHHHTFLQ